MPTACHVAAWVLIIASAAWADGAISVKEHGAIGNGLADDTAAIRSALAAGRAQKKPVYLPHGVYVISGSLELQAQELRGQAHGGWPADAMPQPTLLVRHQNAPAVRMGDAASLHGIAIRYERDITPKPQSAVVLAGIGLSVTNLRLQYCHDGIMADPAINIGRLNIENVFIVQPSGTGVYVTHTLDIPTLRNIEVWCPESMQPGPGFRLGRNDELRMSDCFVFNTEVGFLFEDDALFAARGDRAGSYAVLSNCSTDACIVGVKITGYASLNFSSGNFWNHYEGFWIDSASASVRLAACDLASNVAPSLYVKRARSVLLTGCTVRRAFSRADVFSQRVEAVDSLAITGCHYEAMGPCLQLGAGVRQAAITGNVFEPSPYTLIDNAAAATAEIVISGNAGLAPAAGGMMTH